jgi:hypothetical protein
MLNILMKFDELWQNICEFPSDVPMFDETVEDSCDIFRSVNDSAGHGLGILQYTTSQSCCGNLCDHPRALPRSGAGAGDAHAVRDLYETTEIRWKPLRTQEVLLQFNDAKQLPT